MIIILSENDFLNSKSPTLGLFFFIFIFKTTNTYMFWAPIILRPRVQIPSTTSTLYSICNLALMWKGRNKQKRCRYMSIYFLKKLFVRLWTSPSHCLTLLWERRFAPFECRDDTWTSITTARAPKEGRRHLSVHCLFPDWKCSSVQYFPFQWLWLLGHFVSLSVKYRGATHAPNDKKNLNSIFVCLRKIFLQSSRSHSWHTGWALFSTQ